jgi:YteA family regulatory protein
MLNEIVVKPYKMRLHFPRKEVVYMLTEEQLSIFRTQLQELKSGIENQEKQNDQYGQEDEFPYASTSELSAYDNHPGDLGTELFEREKDIALRYHSDNELQNIEHALKAIDEGTYGKCKECGKEIPFERLEAIPYTLYCKDHSPEQTVSHDRPIEEEVLTPPFGKFVFENNRKESVAYDAEDTWQSVAKYGTSESPSDFIEPKENYNEMYIDADENEGYVEDFENFTGNDMSGKNIQVYRNDEYKEYEHTLDEKNMMTQFGDLPASEHDPYVEDDDKKEKKPKK